MEEGTIGSGIFQAYSIMISALPPVFQSFVNLFFIAVLILGYAWFIWKLYKFVATKNILKLNLNKYNRSQHPLGIKIIAGMLYLTEYFIFLPFLIFFWFSAFTIFLILLTENLSVSALLIISATLIAAIRLSAYYNEDLSREIAKLVPFTLLAVSLLDPSFFSIERIFGQLSQIPTFFNEITIYLVFIIMLEMILRFFDFIFSLFGLEEEQEEKKEN